MNGEVNIFITDESRENAFMSLHKTVVSILVGQPYNTDFGSQPTHKEQIVKFLQGILIYFYLFMSCYFLLWVS